MPHDAQRPCPAQPVVFEQTLSASFEAVRALLAALTATLRDRGLGDEEVSSVELVVAETLNNIVEHAYGAEGLGDIALSVSDSPRGLLFSITDHGDEMPDGALPPGLPADTATALRSMPEGGFGWFLIRELARDLTYCRVDDMNRVTFRVAIGQAIGAH